MKAVDEIDPTSIPGCCLLQKYGSINRDVLKITTDDHGNRTYDPCRLQLLKELSMARYKKVLEGELDADPLKVFVKQEPHKLEKLKEGRYRLIMGVSLIDTVVDRIIFGEMLRNAASPTNVLRTPCAVGWAPNRGGWRFISLYTHNGFSIDRKAWDWTVNEWLIQIWEQFIKDMHPDHPSWWSNLVSRRFTCLFYIARFSFPDGQLIQQGTPGIMKSGCLLTLLLNSVGQTVLHCLAQLRLGKDPYDNIPISMGDDTLQRPFNSMELYAEELAKMALIKEAEYTHNYSEFIGFIFTKTGFYPAYWKKHLFQLRHLDQSVMRETLISYQMLWYHEPNMLKFIRGIAWKINPDWVLTDQQLCENANY